MLSCFLAELCWDCAPKHPFISILQGERAVVGNRKFLFKPRQQLKAFPEQKPLHAFMLQRVCNKFSGEFSSNEGWLKLLDNYSFSCRVCAQGEVLQSFLKPGKPSAELELPSERMCQVEHPNDISNSNYTEREANTPYNCKSATALCNHVCACASDGTLSGAECTSGLFLSSWAEVFSSLIPL